MDLSKALEVPENERLVRQDVVCTSEGESMPGHAPSTAATMEHPISTTLIEEIESLNNWLLWNRQWDSKCLSFKLSDKLIGISRLEHYEQALSRSGAEFIREIRNKLTVGIVSVEVASRLGLLFQYMKTPCKPTEGKGNDEVYNTRYQFLHFLFECYKTSVNNRRPLRTGDLSAINKYIANKIKHFIFGAEDSLHYSNITGTVVGVVPFPTVADIYTAMKRKQKSRGSAEAKTVKKKRKAILAKAKVISDANEAAVAVGLTAPFNSPTRIMSTLIIESPPYSKRNASRGKGRSRVDPQVVFMEYESNVEWSGVKTVRKITKSTKIKAPLKRAASVEDVVTLGNALNSMAMKRGSGSGGKKSEQQQSKKARLVDDDDLLTPHFTRPQHALAVDVDEEDMRGFAELEDMDVESDSADERGQLDMSGEEDNEDNGAEDGDDWDGTF